MSAPPGSIRDLVASYWAAEERRDVAAVMAHFHADATYQDGAGRRDGVEDIRRFYATSADTFPSLVVEVVREFPVESGAAVEFVATLRDHAGEAWVILGLNVFLVADGRFTSVRSYEDAPVRVPGA